MDLNSLTNEDVADIFALLDSLPYDELDLETPRFRLTLRRTPAGWTQSTQVLSAPDPAAGPMSHRAGYNRPDVTSVRLGEDAHGAGKGDVTSGAAEETGGDAAGDAGGD